MQLVCDTYEVPAICYGENERLVAKNMAEMLNSGEHDGQNFADTASLELFGDNRKISQFRRAEVLQLDFETGHISRVEL